MAPPPSHSQSLLPNSDVLILDRIERDAVFTCSGIPRMLRLIDPLSGQLLREHLRRKHPMNTVSFQQAGRKLRGLRL
jgi:hypothetical protein